MNTTIHTITSGRWRQNGYVVSNPGGEALLIDPGSDATRYEAVIEAAGLEPLAILNTHAHYDHVGAVAALMERYQIHFFLHSGDHRLLRQANFFRKVFDGVEPVRMPCSVTALPDEAGDLQFGEFDVQSVSTPGHTDGSVCFLIGKQMFSGDTVLPGGFGRTDLPGGSRLKQATAIQTLKALPADITVYPGHGKPFLLGEHIDRLLADEASVK